MRVMEILHAEMLFLTANINVRIRVTPASLYALLALKIKMQSMFGAVWLIVAALPIFKFNNDLCYMKQEYKIFFERVKANMDSF